MARIAAMAGSAATIVLGVLLLIGELTGVESFDVAAGVIMTVVGCLGLAINLIAAATLGFSDGRTRPRPRRSGASELPEPLGSIDLTL